MAGKKSIIKRRTKVSPAPETFVAEYLKDGNAKQAAIRAGYSSSAASKMGHSMLKRPEVQALLQQRTKAQAERIEISNDRLKYEIQRVAMSSMKNFTVVDTQGMPHFDFNQLSDDDWAAISEITTDTVMESTGEYDDEGKPIKLPVRRMKFKLHSKMDATRLLAQIKGMVTTKQEITNPDGSLRQPPSLNIVVMSHTPKD